MIDPGQLRRIFNISLEPLGYWSLETQELLMMTAAHESLLGRYLQQKAVPALGLYGMEPATLSDIFINYLNYRTELAQK